MNTNDQIAKLSKERDELIRRLMKALEHLSRERQFSILSSYLSMVELRKLVEFQERD
jgi:hypothetical protein